VIRRIAPGGSVTTLAGSPGQAGFSDSPDPAGARFDQPSALAAGVDGQGRDILVVADTGNSAIRLVAADGAVSTLAGTGRAGAVDSADGDAQFNRPAGVALGAAGAVLVADTGNHTLRQIAADGTVTTLAGTAGKPGAADGAGSAASFDSPMGLAMAADGGLYVADAGNHTIRLLQGGQVSTLLGLAGSPGSVDGAGAAARLDRPVALALDAAGNLYVANAGSSTVCVVAPGPAARASTVIGSGLACMNRLDALPALIAGPRGIAVAAGGLRLYLTLDDAALVADFTP
jgi:sugar lactone lactonase YvrE